VNREAVRRLLILDEGLRPFPYVDSVGKVTIGIGHNLTDCGISPAATDLLFEEDLSAAYHILDTLLPDWTTYEDPRQAALVSLAFNLGNRLGQFHTFLANVSQRSWEAAGEALQHSLWFTQVGGRGPRLVGMLQKCQWPDGI